MTDVSKADRPGLDTDLRRLAERAGAEEGTAELLQEAVLATRRIPAVSGAGLMLADPRHVLRYVAVSDEAARTLEILQEEAGEGPCVEAFVRDEIVATSDLGTDARWPRLAGTVGSAPVSAVLGAPLHLAGGAVGTLNVYHEHPHDWTEDETAGLAAFAAVVDSLLTGVAAMRRSDEVAQQLQYALDYRVPIERAVGYLMRQHGADPVAAFARLRAAARNSRRRAVDVARDVLAGELVV